MKKIFTIFAAMLVAMTVSATPKTTNVNPGQGNLNKAIDKADDGDTLLLAAGTYIDIPDGGYLTFNAKSVVVKAAEGAEVIIQPKVQIRMGGAARAEFLGVKIDCGHVNEINSYAYLFYQNDNTAGKILVFNDCEIYGWNKHSALIHTPSDRKMDSIKINNCYIHDCYSSIIYYTNANLVGIEITNSTIANIIQGGGYWAAPIDIRATSGRILVDHCTFYNAQSISLSYGTINVPTITNVVVSNCIMMLESGIDRCATNLPTGGTVKNTLTYNYDNWQPYGHYKTATVTDCKKADPKFRSASNADYVLKYGSPAFYMGEAGCDVGDPRLVPSNKIVYAKMEYNWWTQEGSKIGAYAYCSGSDDKNAEWPGVCMTAVAGEANTWSYELDKKYDKIIFTRLKSNETEYNGAKTQSQDVPSNSNALFTMANTSECWADGCEVNGNWSVYPVNNKLVRLVGTMNGWAATDTFVVASDGLTANYRMYFDGNTSGYEFKIDEGSNTLSIDNGETKYGFNRGNNSAVVDYNNASSKPCWLTIDMAGYYKFTWTYATKNLTVTYPEPAHENGYYLVGKLGAVGKKKGQWDVEDLNASKLFSVNPSDENEYLLTYKLYEGDSIKVVKVEFDEITTWYPSGTDNEYVMTSDQAGDSKVIKFRPAGEVAGWHEGYIFVQGTTTAIDHVIDSEKAVKVLENGQLVIIKNGVRYNVLGTAVK